MRKSTTVLLIVAICLVVTGMILFAITLGINGWDFRHLDTRIFETNTHPISTEFHSILVETDTPDIRVLPSPDRSCKVVCYETENARHTVTAENGTLTIRLVKNQKWYDYIGIQFESPKITVYLPEAVYESLSVHADTGDVEVSDDLTFEQISISVSTGDIHLEDITAKSITMTQSTGDVVARNVQCQQFHSTGSTGDLELHDLTASEIISIARSTGDVNMKASTALQVSIQTDTGDVRFEACDAEEIVIHTDTGDVTGTLLTPKIFQVETDTGRVDVPESGTGGKCQVKTDTGDIQVEILE